MYGYDVRLVDQETGKDVTAPGHKGVVAIEGPLPPGCMQTVWRDDARFVETYWNSIPGRSVYSTFDWAVQDAAGAFHVAAEVLDEAVQAVEAVAAGEGAEGSDIGEIEESIASHPNVSEVAVVGMADALKGQVAVAFAVPRDASLVEGDAARLKFEGEIMKTVDQQLGAVARPARVHVVAALPKTRSGKMLRRALQAVCERRDPGDLTTMEDPAALQAIQSLCAAELM